MIEQLVKWSICALMAFGAIVTVTMVGRPRKPMTGGVAALTVIVQAAFITAIVTYWD